MPPLGVGSGCALWWVCWFSGYPPNVIAVLAGHRSNQRARNDAPLVEPAQVDTPERLRGPSVRGQPSPALFRGLPGLDRGVLARCYELEGIPGSGVPVEHVHEGQAHNVRGVVGQLLGDVHSTEAARASEQAFALELLPSVDGVGRSRSENFTAYLKTSMKPETGRPG